MASGHNVQIQAASAGDDAQLVSMAAGDGGIEYFHYTDPGGGVGAMQGTLQEGPQGQVQIEWTYRGVPNNVPVLVESATVREESLEQLCHTLSIWYKY